MWDSEGFYLNQFMAYNSIPFIDIVDGPMQHTVQCFAYVANFEPGKLSATINLKINLAEVWDFNLEFMDWKTSSIENKEKPGQINPLLKIAMDSPQNLRSLVESEPLKNNTQPYWAALN